METLTNKQKKEYAKILYLNTAMTQKEIAAKVDISENSMSAWVNDDKWDALKTALSITRESELKSLYKQLSLLNKQNEAWLEDDDPNTNPDYDAVRKLTKSIYELSEKQSGVGEIILAQMDFITFVQQQNMEHAQLINNYSDAFIKTRLNTI